MSDVIGIGLFFGGLLLVGWLLEGFAKIEEDARDRARRPDRSEP